MDGGGRWNVKTTFDMVHSSAVARFLPLRAFAHALRTRTHFTSRARAAHAYVYLPYMRDADCTLRIRCSPACTRRAHFAPARIAAAHARAAISGERGGENCWWAKTSGEKRDAAGVSCYSNTGGARAATFSISPQFYSSIFMHFPSLPDFPARFLRRTPARTATRLSCARCALPCKPYACLRSCPYMRGVSHLSISISISDHQ